MLRLGLTRDYNAFCLNHTDMLQDFTGVLGPSDVLWSLPFRTHVQDATAARAAWSREGSGTQIVDELQATASADAKHKPQQPEVQADQALPQRQVVRRLLRQSLPRFCRTARRQGLEHIVAFPAAPLVSGACV